MFCLVVFGYGRLRQDMLHYFCFVRSIIDFDNLNFYEKATFSTFRGRNVYKFVRLTPDNNKNGPPYPSR
jgi:hypothetical protein